MFKVCSEEGVRCVEGLRFTDMRDVDSALTALTILERTCPEEGSKKLWRRLLHDLIMARTILSVGHSDTEGFQGRIKSVPTWVDIHQNRMSGIMHSFRQNCEGLPGAFCRDFKKMRKPRVKPQEVSGGDRMHAWGFTTQVRHSRVICSRLRRRFRELFKDR